MEEQLFEKFPGLENLLESSSFDALTSREKEEVLRYMTPEDYDKYRQTLLQSKALFAAEQKTVKAEPAIKERLLERMKQKRTSSKVNILSSLIGLVTFRIPVYQPGFAVIVLAVLFILLHNEKPETIRYLTRIDTVYMEKESARNDSAEKRQDSVQKRNSVNEKKDESRITRKTEVKTSRPSEPPQNQYVQNAYQKMRMVNRIKSGTSAKDDSALMKFLVTSN
jgi:hypothetical protein